MLYDHGSKSLLFYCTVLYCVEEVENVAWVKNILEREHGQVRTPIIWGETFSSSLSHLYLKRDRSCLTSTINTLTLTFPLRKSLLILKSSVPSNPTLSCPPYSAPLSSALYRLLLYCHVLCWSTSLTPIIHHSLLLILARFLIQN